MEKKNEISGNESKEKSFSPGVTATEANKGANSESESNGKSNEGWAIFSLKIREYERNYSTDKAIKLAIKYCIEKGIHREYLKENAFHVLNIMLQVRADQRSRRKTLKNSSW